MAKKKAKSSKKVTKKKGRAAARAAVGEPKFPYTILPGVLRDLLKEIPQRPKPPKMTLDTVKSWDVSRNTNARTAISVLKKIGLLTTGGEPTEDYVAFMDPKGGPARLGQLVREAYKPIFDHATTPQEDGTDALRSLFNIHSGGAESTINYQIGTFKALCAHATFDTDSTAVGADTGNLAAEAGSTTTRPSAVVPRIELHIHLPPNKSSRDYEAIIQDIGRYIYGTDQP